MVPSALPVAGRTLALPTFFPSISSVKSDFRPAELVELLVGLGEPQFLLSAYDVVRAIEPDRARIDLALKRALEKRACVLLDSGNYESFWHGDQSSWTEAILDGELGAIPVPLAFGFDDQHPSEDVEKSVQDLLSALARDQSKTTSATVCPIVHGPPDTLDQRVRLVAERRQPLMLAVAERELGAGVINRARTVRLLRRTLDRVSASSVLHILGTGSPLAILMYSIAGAQSFDGLEWCRTCVDPETAWLHHFQHRDLVVAAEVELCSKLPYVEGTLAHNLFFLRSWMRRIREALAEGKGLELLANHLPAARRDEVISMIRSLP